MNENTSNTNTNTAEVKTFEMEACSRCGGSGHYSYCQMYGTRCFKCSGRGRVLSKRGAAAAQFLRTLRSKPASEITVGMRIKNNAINPKQVSTVKSIGKTIQRGATLKDGIMVPYETEYLVIETEHCGYHTPADAMVYVVESSEVQKEQFAAALAYQESLTKQGKPRKR